MLEGIGFNLASELKIDLEPKPVLGENSVSLDSAEVSCTLGLDFTSFVWNEFGWNELDAEPVSLFRLPKLFNKPLTELPIRLIAFLVESRFGLGAGF